ncbi:tripartite tricarboxylate transporter substrate binding protein [Roseomonas sp. HJA6]|uniref:Tripartite tricarboxylate transporter substrate binding protein n=1 Tax=Roseomonas alba TaxID=2846776 RepID=A0ABS7ABE0_9PROT|nr:tripartite tricarboxylate transporter substrate binding protein [Neoroseomonas alba]MBW6398479.1 tripartite tricarboxylate transporter substrate binding protein [Neoroseomonas alba]
MHLSRRGVIAASLAAAAVAPARAQAPWPGDEPMRILLPAAQGSAADTAIRAMLPFLAAKLGGARITVDNQQPNEDTYVLMAAAPADGRTLGLLISPQAQALTIGRQARFGLRHFAWIGTIFEDPSGLFVAPSSPLRSIPDILQAAREATDGLTAGTTGIGSDDHLMLVEFERATGARLRHRPFAGRSVLTAALLAGDVQVAALPMAESLPALKDGAIRAIASSGPMRFAFTPDVPTFSEAGYPIDTRAVRSLVAPIGTPVPIVARLDAALAETMRDPAWIAEAQARQIPLKYRPGEDTRQIVLEEEAVLAALWNTRPWR